jgi:hypothetical protein
VAGKYAVLSAVAALVAIVFGLFYVTGFVPVDGFDHGGVIPNVSVTDSTPPTWSEQTQSADSVNVGGTVSLSALLKDDKALKNASLNISTDGTTWTTADTQAVSGTQMIAVFRYTIPNYAPGTRVSWRIIFFDAGNNGGVTDAKTFLISDTQPPEITEQKQEADSVPFGGALLLSAKVSDNYRVDYVIFETNETGKFAEARRYSIGERDAAVSMSWSNPEIKTETFIGWRITAKDSWGNVRTLDVTAFEVRGCPSCQPPTDWSECERTATGELQQYQVYYECNENTDFKCVFRTKTQNCTLGGANREDARSAMEAADAAIAAGKGADKDVREAQNLLAEADAAYARGLWELAKAKADGAKTAAETAKPVEVPGTNYLPYMAAVIVILIALWMLLKFGKIHLPVAQGFTPPPQPEPSKGTGQVCGVCGKPFPKLYTCEECGTRVCFDDARTWQGNIYCINDLRKKGLL